MCFLQIHTCQLSRFCRDRPDLQLSKWPKIGTSRFWDIEKNKIQGKVANIYGLVAYIWARISKKLLINARKVARGHVVNKYLCSWNTYLSQNLTKFSTILLLFYWWFPASYSDFNTLNTFLKIFNDTLESKTGQGSLLILVHQLATVMPLVLMCLLWVGYW